MLCYVCLVAFPRLRYANAVSFCSIHLSLAGSLGSREALLLLLLGPELIFQRRGGDVGGA